MGAKYDRAADEGKVHKARLPTPATQVSELAFATAAIRSAPLFFYTATFFFTRQVFITVSCDVPDMIDHGAIIVDP